MDEYIPEGEKYAVAIGDTVKVQFRKYETVFDATVHKIVADKETGVAAEVAVMIHGNQKQWRTVTPDKIRRIPRNAQEREDAMKVSTYKGELPVTKRGKTRQPNPFDDHAAKGGNHIVELDADDDAEAITKQIKAAATFAGVSARVLPAADGKILFGFVPKQTRKPKA